MARYDREFLVPYLQDVCSLQLTRQKLESLIAGCRREISQINQSAMSSVKKPELERYVDAKDGVGLGGNCLGMVLCFMALITFFASFGASSPVAMLLPLALAIGGAGMVFYSAGAKDRENEEIKIRNNKLEADYELGKMAALVIAEPKTVIVKKRIAYYETEIKKVDKLLTDLYNVNVIPRWYRDLYTSVYLYDWFSNSRADDLDMALNTFVLEQIKEKLDVIIRNQSQIILNQRMMIANQQKAMEQSQRHHQEMMGKLSSIEASNEERNMYLAMIEGNTAASAYFAAAEYLRK